MSNEPIINRILDENPLVGFSVYTHLQVEMVRDLGQQILEILDTTFQPGVVNNNGDYRAYGLFWLWVLSSYEVTRTMSQAEACFSSSLADRVKSFKKKVSILRMPFAKQEYPGEKHPIKGEASIYGIDTQIGDLKFEVKGKVMSMRDLINEFEVLIKSISRADILKRHEESY